MWLLLLCLACSAAAESGPPQKGLPQGGPLYAPHGSPEEGFTTPWSVRPERSFFRMLGWLLTPDPYDEDAAPRVPRIENEGRYLAGHETGTSYTWVGHSTFAIHDGHDVVLTDPIWGERALLPRRLHPPGVPLEAIPGDAFAVISHNHYDHLDAYTVDALPETVQWFVPLGLAEWFRERGGPT